MQSDPIGLAAGLNPFVYINNVPLSFTDPQGLWIQQLIEKLLQEILKKAPEELPKSTAPKVGSEIGKKLCDTSRGAIPDLDGKCRAECLLQLDMSDGVGASGWLEVCVRACVFELKKCKPPQSAFFCPG